MAKWERLLRMQLRALTEKSYAMPQRYYGDPALHITFESEKKSRGSSMAQAQKIEVVDTFHEKTPYEQLLSMWAAWMRLADHQHSLSEGHPQDTKEFMAAGEAVNTMVDDLKRHQWWAVRKAHGICTVWNFPSLDLADALAQAEEALTPKMRQNVATRRYFIAAERVK